VLFLNECLLLLFISLWTQSGNFWIHPNIVTKRSAGAGIAQRYSDGLSWMIGVRVPAGGENFSLHYLVQTECGAHPVSYPMGIRGCYPWVKRAGREADHSLPSSAKIKECVELYFQSPNTPPWRGAQLKKKSTGTTLPVPFTK
jgi:hypothetical protein